MTAVDLARNLPSIATVRALSQSFAVLDAILSPDGYAVYTYAHRWGPDMEIASMSTGSGDEYSIVFTAAGAFIRGFDHESSMSPYADFKTWPGLVESVPEDFAALVTEPAFCDDGVPDPFLAATICLWRRHDDPSWQTGDIDFPAKEDPDGSAWLFRLLVEGTPEAYRTYASDYFDVSLDPVDVRHVFEHHPLTSDLVRRINPDLEPADLTAVLDAIGYPQVRRLGG